MSEEEDPVVTLSRPGHNSLEVRRSQISLSTLSRSFGVSAQANDMILHIACFVCCSCNQGRATVRRESWKESSNKPFASNKRHIEQEYGRERTRARIWKRNTVVSGRAREYRSSFD